MSTGPTVALIRGEALNPYEMQAYAALADDLDILAVGRRNPPHEVDRIELTTVLLHALGESRRLRSIHRRLPIRRDADRLFGLDSAVSGRQILHAAETVLPVSEQAAEIAMAHRSRLVLTCWETIPFRYDDSPVLAARKLKVKAAASMFVAVTPRAREALICEGVEPDRITVIPAAVDCDRFSPDARPAAIRRQLGIPHGAALILYIGRLIQEKGVVELVRAFAAAEDGTSHLLLVGNGDQSERVRLAAAATGVARRVHLLPSLSYAALPELYCGVDLVVAPSLPTPYWEEQFGMVLAEAMACGRPLITTSSGAIPEVVGNAALLVAPYDVIALTNGIQRMLGDRQLRQRYARQARERALSRYAVPVVASKLAAMYDRVLSG